jgi:hypothetical protein
VNPAQFTCQPAPPTTLADHVDETPCPTTLGPLTATLGKTHNAQHSVDVPDLPALNTLASTCTSYELAAPVKLDVVLTTPDHAPGAHGRTSLHRHSYVY